MNRLFPTLLALVLLPATNISLAEVYKTTDAQGNTVFTDSPPTDRAAPVDLEPTNIADSVDVPDRPPTPEPEARPDQQSGGETVVLEPEYINNNDNLREDLYDAHREQERREHIREAAGRPVARPAPAVRHGRR